MLRKGCLGFQTCEFKKWFEWILHEDYDCDNLLPDLITSKTALEELLASESITDDWVVLLLKLFRKVIFAKSSQKKMEILALLRESVFLTKQLRRYLMIWSISKSQEENLEIAECLTDVMLEFLKFFPSSYAELPLDTFKTFLSEIGENKFDKEV